MWGFILLICIVLTAIAGIFFCVGEGDWVGLCQIVLVYLGILFLEDTITKKKKLFFFFEKIHLKIWILTKKLLSLYQETKTN